jgi:hypothetical protein
VYVLGKTQIQSNLKSDGKFQANLNLTRQILGMEFEPWPVHLERKCSSKIKNDDCSVDIDIYTVGKLFFVNDFEKKTMDHIGTKKQKEREKTSIILLFINFRTD